MYPESPFLNTLVESQILKENSCLLNELLPWLCEAPTVTTYRVNLLKTTVESFTNIVQQKLKEKYTEEPKVFQIPELPEMVCISKVEEPIHEDIERKEVIVDTSCASAVLRGAHIYAPGVLAMESGTKVQEEVSVYADLTGVCKRGTSIRLNMPHKLFIGIGVTRMQRYQLYNQNAAMEGIAIEMKSTISGVPTIGNLSSELALLQNLPSIVCVRVLDPQPDEVILDMCAAPGNKTTHIVEMMKDTGIVVALDKTIDKIRHIDDKIKTNNIQSVRTFAFDATKSFNDKQETTSRELLIPPFAANTFDRILLDGPCSSLGNRPTLASKLTTRMLASYPNIQRKLFENAVPLLKPNGVLVYSTCTITEDENECIVAWALKKFPQLRLVDAVPRFGGFGLPNLGLTEQQCSCVQRFGHTNISSKNADTIGFFIAKFVKNN
ncbi:tRNA (cytosine(72)-C(5))-methyltransferase NSUN6 [Teleopsis dalmanni]|uniref:tRNA (cytosine(72)-C(5))-methyltransferase NSUN6 n=1 Tax=Teleopsis dalmanni TaxID=139649 RepID=UPI0018CCCEDF|nr:tRNA (cytosine(72)-C(5))-methyltransferase NSUN6 [Teleopsis dalmanni]